MTISVIQMFPPTQLSSAPTTLYTLSGGNPAAVLGRGRARFTNTNTSTATTVTAYNIPSGGSATVANMFLNAAALPAAAFLDVDIPVIANGGTLQVKSPGSTDVVASAMDGVVFSP